MKKNASKLNLSRETIQQLSGRDLVGVQGGTLIIVTPVFTSLGGLGDKCQGPVVIQNAAIELPPHNNSNGGKSYCIIG